MREPTALRNHLPVALALLLVGAGLVAIAYGAGLFTGGADLPLSTPAPTRQEERLIPTVPPHGTVVVRTWAPAATASPVPAASASPTLAGSASPAASTEASPTMMATRQSGGGIYTPRQRMGFVAPMRDAERYEVA